MKSILLNIFYISLALGLLFAGFYFMTVKYMIILLLEFLIILEIVKMASKFLLDEGMDMHYVIDGSIIYVLREIYILVTDINAVENGPMIMMIYIGLIFAFVYLRGVLIYQEQKFNHKG